MSRITKLLDIWWELLKKKNGPLSGRKEGMANSPSCTH